MGADNIGDLGLGDEASVGCDIATLSGLQVVGHAGVVKEEGGSGTNVKTHVAASAKKEGESTLQPKYSTRAPVPPLMVRLPATLSMTPARNIRN
jgi:hypothetical protein